MNKLAGYLLMGLFLAGAFSLHSEEYVNDYGKKPELKKYYGKSGNKEQATNVYEKLPFSLEGKSYIQSFDVTVNELKGFYTYAFISRAKGLMVSIVTKGQLKFHDGSRYIAASKPGILKKGRTYAFELKFNNDKLLARCVVRDKKGDKIVWDSGEVICDPPADFSSIRYRVKRFEGDESKNNIKWDEEKKNISMTTSHSKGSLDISIDNMKIETSNTGNEDK